MVRGGSFTSTNSRSGTDALIGWLRALLALCANRTHRHPALTHVVLEPLDFMSRMDGMPRAQGCAGAAIARLAALVPRPRLNLTRFHGVFAPNFKHRSRIVPRRPRGTVDRDKPVAPMSWMQRLKRVFAVDIETCPDCGGTLRVIACIEDPPLIAKILGHVRSRAAAEAVQARAPPANSQRALKLL